MNLLGFTPSSLTEAAVLLIIVLVIVFGLLVPRRTLNDVRADRDKRIKEISDERDDWKAAFFATDKTTREAIGQAQALVEVSRTSEAAIRAIPPVNKVEVSDGKD